MTYPTPRAGNDERPSRPCELLGCLADGCNSDTSEYGTIEPLDERDFLYLWWMGHGFQSSSTPGSVSFTLPGLTSVVVDEVVG